MWHKEWMKLIVVSQIGIVFCSVNFDKIFLRIRIFWFERKDCFWFQFQQHWACFVIYFSAFKNNVDIHINHIQSGLSQMGNLHAFSATTFNVWSSSLYWNGTTLIMYWVWYNCLVGINDLLRFTLYLHFTLRF